MCLNRLLPLIAIICVFVTAEAAISNNVVEETCLKFPINESKIYTSKSSVWTFDPKSGNLTVDLSNVLEVETCAAEQYERKKWLRVDLVNIIFC